MRIGKCPNCQGEMFIRSFNWNGWREYKCKKCDYSLDNQDYNHIGFKDCLNEVNENGTN
jgi:DNA-directed RNA polymerase subunit M/transcription elongation factor TFIIS